MMKRNAMLAILALATAFVCSAEDDNSDEKIKRLIVGSNFYIVDHAKPNFSKPQRDDSGCLS